MFYNRDIVTFEAIEDARDKCRQMNRDAFNSVGITDFKYINTLVSASQCRYFVRCNHVFDDVGGLIETNGYTVYERIVV